MLRVLEKGEIVLSRPQYKISSPDQALATYLVIGQSVPYARASQFLQELFGVQLAAGSIARFVTTCHQQLAEVEIQLKAALMHVPVLNQDETGLLS